MSIATLRADRYRVEAPELVGPLDSFWQRVGDRAADGGALVGFDFPIGVPREFADRVGASSFLELLMEFGHGGWEDFYRLAERPGEISTRRPFYPYRPGGTRQAHLVDGLGVESMACLLRRCERATDTRGPASPLFWTLGGKQVGRAAIIGWRDLLAPGLVSDEIDLRIWPFHGTLSELLRPGCITVVETYPAEACVHLGMDPPGRGWSKTSQEGRRSRGTDILRWAEDQSVELDDDLRSDLVAGFGPSKSAEDPFDAVLGVLSMIDVVSGGRASGLPRDDEAVQHCEGWILGQMADS